MIDHLKKSGRGVKVAKFEEKDQEEFDILVVGGGATGSGVALDATSRGLKVALVERDDFSSGPLFFLFLSLFLIPLCSPGKPSSLSFTSVRFPLGSLCILGTSSKSTKLVHGGVRYLQKAIFELDYGSCPFPFYLVSTAPDSQTFLLF